VNKPCCCSARPPRTEIVALIALLAQSGHKLPDQFENLDVLTPFGAIYRYEDYDAAISLNRHAARESLRELRAWVETKFRERTN